jgi:hypothetical protein
MEWVGHVAYTGERPEVRTEFLSEYLKERDHLLDIGVDGRIFKLDLGEAGCKGFRIRVYTVQ